MYWNVFGLPKVNPRYRECMCVCVCASFRYPWCMELMITLWGLAFWSEDSKKHNSCWKTKQVGQLRSLLCVPKTRPLTWPEGLFWTPGSASRDEKEPLTQWQHPKHLKLNFDTWIASSPTSTTVRLFNLLQYNVAHTVRCFPSRNYLLVSEWFLAISLKAPVFDAVIIQLKALYVDCLINCN